jgi:hypothetical protein
VTQSGHRAGPQVAAVHQRGVEFADAVGRDHGTPAGVEERIVLEHLDRRDDGVDRRATGVEMSLPGPQRTLEAGPVLRGAFGRQFRGRDVSGAPVHGNGRHEPTILGV